MEPPTSRRLEKPKERFGDLLEDNDRNGKIKFSEI